jgi:hypothetical protein
VVIKFGNTQFLIFQVFEKIYEHNEDWIQYEIAELRVALERAEKIKALHNGMHIILGHDPVCSIVTTGWIVQMFKLEGGLCKGVEELCYG